MFNREPHREQSLSAPGVVGPIERTICYHCDGTGVALRMTPNGADSPTCAACDGTGTMPNRERIDQCDLCSGEPDYGFGIPVNLLDGGVEEQWRQVCDSCAATILRAVAHGMR